jgi:hypothetical protein
MERCLLLHARRYDFKDETTGRKVQGVKLTYLTGDVEAGDDQIGQVPLAISAPFDVWNDLGAVPGFYDVEFRQRPGKGGKPELKAVGLDFIEPVDLDGPGALLMLETSSARAAAGAHADDV